MSLRRDNLSWVLVLSILVLLGVAVVYLLLPYMQPHTSIQLGDGVFAAQVRVAHNNADDITVESTELVADKALLVVYGTDDLWQVPMKNHLFPLDLVWLNKDKKVVYIATNVNPDTVTDTVLTPKEPARYILELPIGTVDQKAITTNSSATFDEHVMGGLSS
jgi:uncharacterized protein